MYERKCYRNFQGLEMIMMIYSFIRMFMLIKNFKNLELLQMKKNGIYGIYIRVFFFGLSPGRTNLMDSATEFIQLVLPTSIFNTFR